MQSVQSMQSTPSMPSFPEPWWKKVNTKWNRPLFIPGLFAYAHP